MRSRRHRAGALLRLAFLFVSLLSVAPLANRPPSPVAAQAAGDWQLRLNHVYGVALEVPESWSLDVSAVLNARYGKYRGADGSVTLAGKSSTNSDLEQVCQQTSLSHPYQIIEGPHGRFCLIQPTNPVLGHTALIPYPEPRQIVAPVVETARYLQLNGSAAHLRRIAESTYVPATVSAPLFVAGALDLVQANHVERRRIGWPALRADVLARVTEQSDREAAYAALEYLEQRLLALVGDDHGFVLRPIEVAQIRAGDTWNDTGIVTAPDGRITFVRPGSPADRAGVRINDVIETVNGVPVGAFVPSDDYTELTFVIRPQAGGPVVTVTLPREQYSRYIPARGRVLSGGIGYVETFGLFVESVSLMVDSASDTHELFRSLDQAPRCGWIVDLRRNTGGSLPGILNGITPLLEDGVVQLWRDGDNSWWNATLSGGQIRGPGYGGSQSFVRNPYKVKNARPPIAILTSVNTQSAGESSAFTLLYRQQGESRTFGERTVGLTTSLLSYMLHDGGQLWVESYIGARPDRTLWPVDGLQPDVPMQPDYARYGTDQDPMIQAAHAWLAGTPACAAYQPPPCELCNTIYTPLVSH